MTATRYIIEELEWLIGKFPHVRVRYEYDRIAEVHFVEVIPNNVYHLDDRYIAWEDRITDIFIDRFPTQNICFISDDSFVSIRNAEYIGEGLTFAPLSANDSPIAIASGEITIEQTSIFDSGESTTLTERNEKDLSLKYMIPTTHTYRLAA